MVESLLLFVEQFSDHITVSDVVLFEERMSSFNFWVIQLCDGDGYVENSVQYH
ncbi:MAG: hypothetical protein HRT37_15555 [Alteromonadaceae bacterium]|nr:hypothetical protein [Alteromonadaceae bacterium]